MNKSKALITGFLVLLLFGFFIKNQLSLDPDLGWHIRMGEYILANGIPKTDPLSYTMRSFPFVDHEWLSNIAVYLLNKISPSLLSLVFAALPVVVIIICLPKKINKLSFSIILLSATALFNFAGVRVQEVTWVLFAILLKILFDENLWKRFRFFIPVLVAFWANLHGAFIMGPLVLFVFIAVRALLKKSDVSDYLVLMLSILATLVNPYGIMLWGEVFGQGFDAGLRFSIIEWLPPIFFYSLSFWLLLAFVLALLYKFYKSFPPEKLAVYIFLLLLAFTSTRHIPLLIISSLILTPSLVGVFYKSIKVKGALRRLNIVATIFLVICIALFTSRIHVAATSQSLSEDAFYPKKAVAFLKQNKFSGELFSVYDWGGYLDWKFPSKRVFVDGRMPSWRWKAPLSESDSAYRDYEVIISGSPDYKKLFRKYGIKVVLLPKITFEGKALEKQLIKDGWRSVHEDKVSRVLISFN